MANPNAIKLINDRELNISDFINFLKSLDIELGILAFSILKDGLELYKYTGNNSKILTEIDNQIETNSDGLRDFFANTYTVDSVDVTIKDKVNELLVDNSDTLPEENNLKIYRYIDKSFTNFDLVNYGLLKLYEQKEYLKGELTRVKYWANYNDTDGFNDLVVQEDYIYTKDALGYTQVETVNIDWYNEDDTVGFTKTMSIVYDTIKALRKGYFRRVRIIDEVKSVTIGLIAQTEQIALGDAEAIGIEFLGNYATEIVLYKEGDRQVMIDKLTNDTSYTWLDNVIDANGTTVRQYILSILTY